MKTESHTSVVSEHHFNHHHHQRQKEKSEERSKYQKQYQCNWCRRLLQNPSGLIRHKTYCVWNPALRQQKVEKREQPEETRDRDEMQCEWCNRFFNSHHGVERHKTYCAWHPQRLKALKEQRKRRRDEKANYRRQAELESKLKSEKRRLSYEKNIDEGCYPHSPESESDDHFHVTNSPLTPPPRPSVIRSNVADCTCGCTYVEMELDEEEIDVETV